MTVDTERWVIIPGDVHPSPNFTTKWHRNPISGHEWPETIDLPGFNVGGHKFRSLKAAQEHADWMNANKIPVPMSDREIAKYKRTRGVAS